MRNLYPLVACFSILLLGCGAGGGPTRFPVSGTVKIDGVPAGLVTVRFIPTGPRANPTYGGIVVADATGTFTLGTDGTNSGLPAGQYKVTFSQTLIGGVPTLGGSGGKETETSAIEVEGVPESYRDPNTTTESITVSKNSKPFAFDLKKQ
jgi:hypothetical protein